MLLLWNISFCPSRQLQWASNNSLCRISLVCWYMKYTLTSSWQWNKGFFTEWHLPKSARISKPAPRLLTPGRSSSSSLLHIGAPLPQHLIAELVGQLLLYLFHLPSFAVVAQRSCHLLIGHFFTVSFLDSPTMRQGLLVLGGKLECPFVPVHPPDAVLHVAFS